MRVYMVPVDTMNKMLLDFQVTKILLMCIFVLLLIATATRIVYIVRKDDNDSCGKR